MLTVLLKEFDQEFGAFTWVEGEMIRTGAARAIETVRDPYTGDVFAPTDGERFLIALLRAYRSPHTMATTRDEALMAKAKERPDALV